ncbi:MAG: hypothetical protein GX620_03280 [Chloroflexi bacterium]|nr:hypothetical protein [Chloroflexota bacterium]
MQTRKRLAYIGGGSMFVPSIINGIAEVMRNSPSSYGVELALYDVQPAKAERMQAYAELVSTTWRVPLQAVVSRTRQEALIDADVVLLSVWLHDVHERLEQVLKGVDLHMEEDGLGVVAWALACAPWSLGVAADMKQLCPEALLLTLMNPTDVIAGVVTEATGIRAAGLCVEVDGLRGVLAYTFRVPEHAIVLHHAGVNHDGWVLNIQVRGQDGYTLWQDRWDELEQVQDYHPGTRGIRAIRDLTGYLRSSAYHNWPYQIGQTESERHLWEAWRGKRERCELALDRAIETGRPICDPAGIHPERSALNYPLTGVTVGRLMQSIAASRPEVIALQVHNQGAITNFPVNSIVEIPVLVKDSTLHPMPVGELPDWLGGYTRLLAVQRRLLIDYLLEPHLDTLKRALAVLPMLGPVRELNRFAETLHREYGVDNRRS